MLQSRFGWIIVLGIVIIVNIIGAIVHKRIDLTSEKRYTLSSASKEILRKLDDPVTVQLFFKGEFPAGYRRLADGVIEFLEEMKEEANGKLIIRNSDPFEGLTDSTAARFRDSLQYFFGIPATTLQAPSKVGDELTQKVVLPGAIIQYRDTSIGVNLLQGVKAFGTEPEQLAALYNAIEATLEYKFSSAIQKATTETAPLIGYAVGNGEGWGYNVDEAVRTLFNEYSFDTVNIPQAAFIPEEFDALIILKPTITFSSADKLKIDQYVMRGGRVFWMIDNMFAEFDSLRNSNGFIAFDRQLNLEDLLFRYGARINQNLLQDMDCDKLPQVSGSAEDGQQRRLVDWPFFPLLNGTDHPITKNLDKVRAIFPNTVDTVAAQGIKKTFLLRSSNNARILTTPAKIDFTFFQIAPSADLFTVKDTGVAVLLEGQFRSLFTGRLSSTAADTLNRIGRPFIGQATQPGKMIIVADGDIAINEFHPTQGPLPMGFNQYIPFMYANREFYSNCLEYLVNPSDILSTRSKEYTLRLLDPMLVREQKSKWQMINIVLPVIITILFAVIFQSLRKRRFA